MGIRSLIASGLRLIGRGPESDAVRAQKKRAEVGRKILQEQLDHARIHVDSGEVTRRCATYQCRMRDDDPRLVRHFCGKGSRR